jgi:hypothetical protein
MGTRSPPVRERSLPHVLMAGRWELDEPRGSSPVLRRPVVRAWSPLVTSLLVGRLFFDMLAGYDVDSGWESAPERSTRRAVAEE